MQGYSGRLNELGTFKTKHSGTCIFAASQTTCYLIDFEKREAYSILKAEEEANLKMILKGKEMMIVEKTDGYPEIVL